MSVSQSSSRGSRGRGWGGQGRRMWGGLLLALAAVQYNQKEYKEALNT